jgi:CTP synthase
MAASNSKTKYIFVTGGVVSSLGKGILASSLGLLLKSRGHSVQFQKLDPYLNVDPGTMNPYQHGEVFITADGAETDLDLGHYERFTGIEATKNSNFTAGWIYSTVISEERKGASLGETIQVVPHITNEIKRCIKSIGKEGVDYAIVEIGGTVGDIESLPFMEAIRQFSLEVGPSKSMFVHLTLVPYISAAGELKTKPTQHSVAKLREIGIQPQVLVCRSEQELDGDLRGKLSLFCSIAKEAVIQCPDVDNIYRVPSVLAAEGLDRLILRHFGQEITKRRMTRWEEMLRKVDAAQEELTVAVVGKYIELQDAYKSIYESLRHAAIDEGLKLNILRVSSEKEDDIKALVGQVDGVLVPGGFGCRGVEGKILAAQICRENDIPYFGICMGMQVAAIEFARNVCGLKGANSLELDESTQHPVIAIMEDQKKVTEKGGTMRLGNYPCHLNEGSRSREVYHRKDIQERHRHRYEFNNAFLDLFKDKGMVIAGQCPDNGLVEVIELHDHPWYVGCQYHPEFKSSPVNPHPLFSGFIKAAKEHQS